MEQFKKMLVEAIESSNEEFEAPFTSNIQNMILSL
jgi:hypothetical protein